MKKKSRKIFDMHVDPLVQATLFKYDISKSHKYDWKPDPGNNRILWNFYRDFLFDPQQSPMFNHVDVPRMINDENSQMAYQAAGFGVVQPKLRYFGFDSESDGQNYDLNEYGSFEDDISLLEETLHNSLVHSQFEDYWMTLRENKNLKALEDMVQEQLDSFDLLLIKAKDKVYQLREPEDLVKEENSDKLGIFLTLEGAHCLDEIHFSKKRKHLRDEKEYLDKLEKVCNRYHIRYITLHHFVHNALGNCSLNPLRGPKYQKRANKVGLKDLGISFVKKMHDLGIIVDVSHTCTQAIKDIFDCQKAYIDANKVNILAGSEVGKNIPIIASHAASRTAYEELINEGNKTKSDLSYREELWKWRGLADESIKYIAQTGGVIGVTVCPKHLRGSNEGTVEDWAYHCHTICNIIESIGPEYEGKGKDFLAIGTDFDGWIPSLPDTMKDCRDLDKCIEALNASKYNRTFNEDDIAALCSGNFVRAWTKVRNARTMTNKTLI